LTSLSSILPFARSAAKEVLKLQHDAEVTSAGLAMEVAEGKTWLEEVTTGKTVHRPSAKASLSVSFTDTVTKTDTSSFQ
jgi:hypothetical protein